MIPKMHGKHLQTGWSKKLVSLLMVVILILGVLPVAALAAGDGNWYMDFSAPGVQPEDQGFLDGTYINGAFYQYLTSNNEQQHLMLDASLLNAGEVNTFSVTIGNKSGDYDESLAPNASNYDDFAVGAFVMTLPSGETAMPTQVKLYTPVDSTTPAVDNHNETLQDYDGSVSYAMGDGYPGGSNTTLAYRIDFIFDLSADTTAPVITAPESAAIMVGDAFDTLAGVSATDNVDGDLTSAILVSGGVDTTVAGVYTLTYTVSDAAGNTATAAQTVTVSAPAATGDGHAYMDFNAPGVQPEDQGFLDGTYINGTFYQYLTSNNEQQHLTLDASRLHTGQVNTFSVTIGNASGDYNTGIAPNATNYDDFSVGSFSLTLPNGETYTPTQVVIYTPVDSSTPAGTQHNENTLDYSTELYAMGDGYPGGSNTSLPYRIDFVFDLTSTSWDGTYDEDDVPPPTPALDTIKDVSLEVGSDQTQRNIAWYATSTQAGKVQIALKSAQTGTEFPANYQEFTATPGTTSQAGYQSEKATITGLAANTEYVYRVGNDEGWSNVYSFTTQSFDGAFSFLAAGDPQIGAAGITHDVAGWTSTLNKAFAMFPQTSFLVTLGDQVSSASSEAQYDALLSPDVLKSLPLATVVGNHDVSHNYTEHFNMPNVSAVAGGTGAGEGGGDYWYVYNSTLFMSLNINDLSAASHKAFLQSAIAANPDVQWKIVTEHFTLFSITNSGYWNVTQPLRDELAPVFSELGVDVVLDGHDHSYMRSYLMNGTTPDTTTGGSSVSAAAGKVLYINANSASGSLYCGLGSTNYPFVAFKNQENVPNISNISITDTSFTITTYRTSDMSVVDSFTINKTAATGDGNWHMDFNAPGVQPEDQGFLNGTYINGTFNQYLTSNDTNQRLTLDASLLNTGEANTFSVTIGNTSGDYNTSLAPNASNYDDFSVGTFVMTLPSGETAVPTQVRLYTPVDSTTPASENHNETLQDYDSSVSYAMGDGYPGGSNTTLAYKIDFIFDLTVDSTAPVITVPDSPAIETGDTFDPMDGVSATDDVDGDLTSAISVSGSVNTAIPGTYTLTYMVSDNAGNMATATLTVTVSAPANGDGNAYMDFASSGIQTQDTTWHFKDASYINGVFYQYLSNDAEQQRMTLDASKLVPGQTNSFSITVGDSNGDYHTNLAPNATNYDDFSVGNFVLTLPNGETYAPTQVVIYTPVDSTTPADTQHNENTADYSTDLYAMGDGYPGGSNTSLPYRIDFVFDLTETDWDGDGNDETPVLDSVKDLTMQYGSDETSMNFTWYFSSKVETAKVQIALKSAMTGDTFPESEATTFDGTAVVSGSFLSGKVSVTGLTADTEYVYRVGDGTSFSEVYSFKTHDTASYSAILVGDPQIGSGGYLNGMDGWQDTVTEALTAYPDTSFIISAGDQVNTSTNEEQYDGFFSPAELTSMPLIPAVGNHDNNALYSYHYNSPNESATYGTTSAGGDYWFTYGSTLYMVLNSNNQSAASHDAFMQEAIDLAGDGITWTVVMFHHSIYSSASHSTDSDILSRRSDLYPVFDKYDIDVVLMGHDHCYTRSYIMKGGVATTDDTKGASITNPDGTLYITANTGSGSKYYDMKTADTAYSAVHWQGYAPSYSAVEVTEDSFTITTYKVSDGSVIDTFTINKASVSIPVQTARDALVSEMNTGKYTTASVSAAQLVVDSADAAIADGTSVAREAELLAALSDAMNALVLINQTSLEVAPNTILGSDRTITFRVSVDQLQNVDVMEGFVKISDDRFRILSIESLYSGSGFIFTQNPNFNGDGLTGYFSLAQVGGFADTARLDVVDITIKLKNGMTADSLEAALDSITMYIGNSDTHTSVEVYCSVTGDGTAVTNIWLPSDVKGDVDGDGLLKGNDLSLAMTYFGAADSDTDWYTSGAWMVDYNSDGVIDIGDLMAQACLVANLKIV